MKKAFKALITAFRNFRDALPKAFSGNKEALTYVISVIATLLVSCGIIAVLVVLAVKVVPVVLGFGLLAYIFLPIDEWIAKKQSSVSVAATPSVRVGEQLPSSKIAPEIVKKEFQELKKYFDVCFLVDVQENANCIRYIFNIRMKTGNEVNLDFLLLIHSIAAGVLTRYLQKQHCYADASILAAVDIINNQLFIFYAKNQDGIPFIQERNESVRLRFEGNERNDDMMSESWDENKDKDKDRDEDEDKDRDENDGNNE